ncbi:MAG: sigma-54 dependent transcriptional regulator [Acidobacteriota bacterium]
MKSRGLVLIVDDDASLHLESYLSSTPYEIRRAFDCESALRHLMDWVGQEKEAPCLALVDIVLPITATDRRTDPRGGLKLMPELKRIAPQVQLIPITGKGWGSESTDQKDILDEARQIGIRDYISKPITRNEVLAVVEKAFGLRQGRSTVQSDIKRYPVDFGDGDRRYIVSVDKTMQDQVIGRIVMEASNDRPVIILGETGTGKELVARAVHGASRRTRFLSVNCAAIPESLIESELFGYERGAFSGAVRRKKGKFELAHGGTLFLDEVGDLSLTAQAKLLRVLQEQQLERVGGTETLQVDVRIVAATNQDLEEKIDSGKFRADLYYRLEGLVIEIPPLRQRRDDIELIARYHLEALNERHGCQKNFDDQALVALVEYNWPGNVRELQNVVNHLYYASRGSTFLVTTDLPKRLRARRCRVTQTLDQLAAEVLQDSRLSLDVLSMLLAERVYRKAGKDHRRASQALEISANTLYKYKRSLEEITTALIDTNFDEKAAARRLPDFGSATFLRKRVRSLLYGKTKQDIQAEGKRAGYPTEWTSYMTNAIASQITGESPQ